MREEIKEIIDSIKDERVLKIIYAILIGIKRSD